MAEASNFPVVRKTQEKGFPFMLLHLELRQMVYQEIFSRRGIVLRERLDPPGTFGCGRRYLHFWLDNARETDDDVIALLQTSRQILTEAKPLLLRDTPSHLTLSKDNHKLPTTAYEEKKIADLGLPFQYITNLNLNIKTLGTNERSPKICPGLQDPDQCVFPLSDCSFGFGDDGHLDGIVLPDPPRDPNLQGVWEFSYFFATLPALREIHIYDALKHHLSSSRTCFCPIKGVESCICGECQCDCAVHPSLPNSPDASVTSTRDVLYNALLSRFRAALPVPEDVPWRVTDYRVVSQALEFGIHLFLHEEIAIRIPSKNGKSSHKGLWRAKYHLIPPDDAKRPAERPAKPAETPRQGRLRKKKEAEMKARWREEQGLDPEPFDFAQLLPDYINMGIPNPQIPEGLEEKPLVEFEAGLQLELVGESEFDTVLEDAALESHQATMEKKYGKLWQWD